jgi:hypothetical protein
MQINRENYETYFIDFIDGKLTPSDEEIFRDFLKSNPDLAKELEGLEIVTLMPEEIGFSSKKSLRKSDSPVGVDSRLDYLCIAKVENDLTQAETIELDDIVRDSETAKKNLFEYTQTRLVPDINIAYKDKLKLKRFTVFQLSYRALLSAGSAAAVVLIVLGVFAILKQDVDFIGVEMATVTEPVQEQIEKDVTVEKIEEVQSDVIVNTEKPILKEEIPKKVVEQSEVLIANVENNAQDFEVGFDMVNRIDFNGLTEPTMQHSNKVLIALAQANFPEMENNQSNEYRRTAGTREIGLFELAQMGFSRLSNYTGRDINLDAEKDQDGNIRKISFETELFALSVPVKKRD